ncbi:MAG: hypothetical protein DBP02_01965 [gamma proteobacterium symbiont of Ctena orbiculata]|nr:MAG: hypothetical protein DBP02_01965 [gamma proteobacterium symbiont of Ctena orbiculata]
MNHKIVCWGDYAIPVPLWARWMAMDESGFWYSYGTKPNIHGDIWCCSVHWERITISATPPEPGPWDEQLYWIGD